MITTNQTRWLALAAASLLLVACAGSGTRTSGTSTAGTSHDVLKQRAAQRWQDLIHKQAEKAYDYLTPGYRATISRKDYAARMNNRPVHWESVKVDKVTCESANNCIVRVEVGYNAAMPGIPSRVRSVAPVDERWLLVDGQWYNLPDELGSNLK